VTEENKKEYIALVCEHRLRGRVEKQLEAFKGGVDEIVPLRELRVFDEKELEVRFPLEMPLFPSRLSHLSENNGIDLLGPSCTAHHRWYR
jgi:hypothetical protein